MSTGVQANLRNLLLEPDQALKALQMHIATLATLALAGSAFAQSSSSTTSALTGTTPSATTANARGLTSVSVSTLTAKTGSSTTAKAATAKTTGGVKHVVQVGNAAGALTFTPNIISASVGHMVEFVFNPHNHSVAQAAFDSPCVPMDQSASMKGMTGFYSGFVPVGNTSATTSPGMDGTNTTKTFTIMIESAQPMWFYCSQGMHCQAGMVGVINPKNASGQTLETFMAGAKKAPKNISPAKVAGGCGPGMMSSDMVSQAAGVAKATGAKTATMKSGVAQATGMMKINGTTKSTTKAMGMASMTTSGAVAGAAAAKTTAAAAMAASSMVSSASLSAAAANSTGIKQSNSAARSRDLLEAGSSFGLLVCLAATIVLFA